MKPERRLQIEGWIEQLGNDDFGVRRKARLALLAAPEARPLLAQAQDCPEPEIRYQTREILETLPRPREGPLVAVLRQIGREPPEGAVPTLLAFLADQEDPETRDYLARLLVRLGVREARPHPALLAGLSDRSLAVRLAAVEVLARADLPDRTPARKALLEALRDPSQEVRFRTASLLFDARDRTAVPALIQLLVPATPGQRELIETRLGVLAAGVPSIPGPHAPSDQVRSLPVEKRRLAWQRWWLAHGGAIDLARLNLPPTRLGYLLVALETPGRAAGGRVQEYDARGRLRWEITDLVSPVSAQVVGPDRVLICEAGELLTERNLSGEIVWRYNPEETLLSARRLANGHLLLFSRNQVVQINEAGKEVASLRSDGTILAAHRDPEGRTHLLKNSGQYELRGSSGELIKRFSVSFSWFRTWQPHFLPDGHLLIADYSNSRVLEVDGAGRVVWEASTSRPSVVHRLPNGHTLVTGRRTSLIELDRDGEQVGVFALPGRVTFLSSR
jgi:hypothetical protein